MSNEQKIGASVVNYFYEFSAALARKFGYSLFGTTFRNEQIWYCYSNEKKATILRKLLLVIVTKQPVHFFVPM
jgi:hypothetical protein